MKLSQDYGFAPYVVRRIAGLFAVIGTFQVRDIYDPIVLKATGVHPVGGWDEPGEQAATLERVRVLVAFENAANAGHAIVMAVTL